MDIIIARSFLAVVETGSFVAAGRRVNATQSTISARIKSLEEQLGKRVFDRSKSGASLTPAGRQFLRYAQTLVRVWEEARHQVAVPSGYEESIVVGGQYSLWDGLLTGWLTKFRAASPRVAVRCEIGMPQRLMHELVDGSLDLAVIYRPELRAGLIVERIIDDRLILVTPDAGRPYSDHYAFVDWGEEFMRRHAEAFPTLHNPGLTLDLGAFSAEVLVSERAAGYLPERIARRWIRAGLLHQEEDAPEFLYPAYLVHREHFASTETIKRAISLLRTEAQAGAGATETSG